MTTQTIDKSVLAQYELIYNDPRYWLGNSPHGGYVDGGYKDFRHNELRVNEIKKLAPTSVLDVGCAFGYLVNRLRNEKIDAYGIDVSKFALAQSPPEVRQYLYQGFSHDLSPLEDKSIDLIVSFGMFEHLTDELLEATIVEFNRVAKRVLVGVSLSTDFTDSHHTHNEHPQSHDLKWWRARLPKHWLVCSDSLESWLPSASTRVIIIAPTIYPLGKIGYGGIERLSNLFAESFQKRRFETLIAATRDSKIPYGVTLIDAGYPSDFAETQLNQAMSVFLRTVGDGLPHCMIDLSHSHPVCGFQYLPSLTAIWHDPAMMEVNMPRYNIIALSEWQAERLKRFRNREAYVLDPIFADEAYYDLPKEKVEMTDRFMFIGKLHPSKGALKAIEICRRAKVGLDIIGPITPGDPPDYVREVLDSCDGEQIVYHGETNDDAKLFLMHTRQALIYPVSYPKGFGEAHSHKGIEGMLAGIPFVAYNQGAMNEVVKENVTGFVADNEAEFIEAMKNAHKINRLKCRQEAMKRWSIAACMNRFIPVMKEVAKGYRW